MVDKQFSQNKLLWLNFLPMLLMALNPLLSNNNCWLILEGKLSKARSSQSARIRNGRPPFSSRESKFVNHWTIRELEVLQLPLTCNWVGKWQIESLAAENLSLGPNLSIFFLFHLFLFFGIVLSGRCFQIESLEATQQTGANKTANQWIDTESRGEDKSNCNGIRSIFSSLFSPKYSRLRRRRRCSCWRNYLITLCLEWLKNNLI